jgi:hypothetical protein
MPPKRNKRKPQAAPASEIYENGVDSLRIGMEFFLKERNYSSRKHAILTLFNSIELFLKELLFRTHPLLIYKNSDTKITEDALTVGKCGRCHPIPIRI